MDNKNIFAYNLKRLINKSNKTRKEVCEDLGFNYYTFTDWVNGRKYPRMDKVEALAKYFGVRKSDLIEQQNNPEDPPKDAMFSLEEAQNLLMSQEAILFDGEPMDDETRELLLISLKNTMILAEKLSKKRKK